jgi:hypothetical protein
MGPVFLPRYAAEGLEWAHFCQSEKLPMAFNGPIAASQRNCRWPGMGLLLPVGQTADGLEWAHCFQLDKLPMALNGPISAGQRNCQWP